jgi:hypothetical protein
VRRDETIDWNGLFYSEEKEWRARLLEHGIEQPPPAQATPQHHDLGGSGDRRTEATDCDFLTEAGRQKAIDDYKRHWTTESSKCSEAALARTANVNPADLSKWKKALLPEESDKTRRIERVLKNNERPTPTARLSPEK